MKKDLKSGCLIETRINKPSILELADDYLEYKIGTNVPVMHRKQLSQKHINSISQNLRDFLTFLNTNGINVRSQELKSITEFKADLYYQKLLEKYAIGSLRTKITLLRNWIDWCVKKKNINITNVFANVSIPKTKKGVEAVSSKEFNALIEEINKGSLIVENVHAGKIKRREAYRDYLATCYTLAILTGLRKEELIQLKWTDLGRTKNNNQLVFIVRNIKVENQLKKEYAPKVIPVNSELMDFLKTLNVEENEGKDEFIIHPERIYSEASMRNDISKSFLYYFRAVFPDKESKPFKALRRTYITHLHSALGKDVVNLTSHSGEKVLIEHYIDSQLISKAIDLNILK
jgi:integrase